MLGGGDRLTGPPDGSVRVGPDGDEVVVPVLPPLIIVDPVAVPVLLPTLAPVAQRDALDTHRPLGQTNGDAEGQPPMDVVLLVLH